MRPWHVPALHALDAGLDASADDTAVGAAPTSGAVEGGTDDHDTCTGVQMVVSPHVFGTPKQVSPHGFDPTCTTQ